MTFASLKPYGSARCEAMLKSFLSGFCSAFSQEHSYNALLLRQGTKVHQSIDSKLIVLVADVGPLSSNEKKLLLAF